MWLDYNFQFSFSFIRKRFHLLLNLYYELPSVEFWCLNLFMLFLLFLFFIMHALIFFVFSLPFLFNFFSHYQLFEDCPNFSYFTLFSSILLINIILFHLHWYHFILSSFVLFYFIFINIILFYLHLYHFILS